MAHFLNWSAESRVTVGAIEAEEGFEVNASDGFYQSVSSSIMGTYGRGGAGDGRKMKKVRGS
jgi:hypothetical protein